MKFVFFSSFPWISKRSDKKERRSTLSLFLSDVWDLPLRILIGLANDCSSSSSTCFHKVEEAQVGLMTFSKQNEGHF